MPNKNFLLAIFLLYAIARIALNIPALQKPRELADTAAYLRISREPLQNQKFWGDSRPFVFPLLLKISQQDVSSAAALHLGFSILAWAFLALAINASFRPSNWTLFPFSMILALSLVRHLASWDYVMMTESLSVSFLVLFLAAGIWLMQGWNTYKLILLILVSFLLAFTRDTNAYLLLMLAGMLMFAAILHWAKPQALIPAAFFVLIFLLNNHASNLGGRWIFPLNNIVGRRILVDSSALKYFESACEMPITPELLALANTFANGQDRAFYDDLALESYRVWLYENGKSCYMKYLLVHPVQSLAESLSQFESLIRFDNINKFYARKYDPVIPYYIEPFIYPVNFILPAWVMLTLAAIIATWKRAWRLNPLWGIYILLCLPILPHLFITWHGDAMAPERHALSVGLQIALCFWILIFLILDNLLNNKPNALQKIIMHIYMLPMLAPLWPRVHHRMDAFFYRITKNKTSLTEILGGYAIVRLTSIGAKTGQPRIIPLVALLDGEKIILIASNFGGERNPSWYYNLKANPKCTGEINARAREYTARQAEGAEREEYWGMAVAYYPGYARYKITAAPRQIPVMILEPVI